jgi:hypothetical protein
MVEGANALFKAIFDVRTDANDLDLALPSP